MPSVTWLPHQHNYNNYVNVSCTYKEQEPIVKIGKCFKIKKYLKAEQLRLNSVDSKEFPDPSPITSPLKTDRKRSHKLQEYRSKGPIASTDLDYKER